jgi:tetratricopeptide (TPR) repeat protein
MTGGEASAGMTEPPKRFALFLSSFSTEGFDAPAADPLSILRRDVHALGLELGKPVWVAECDDADRNELATLREGNDMLGVIDLLMSRVAQSEQFVCVLAGSRLGVMEHGCPVEVNGAASAVSHFEIELFQAAMSGLNVKLFVMRGFRPGRRLQNLLRMLDFALPDWTDRRVLSANEIVAEIRALLVGPVNQAGFDSQAQLSSALYNARARAAKSSPLLFLDGYVEEPFREPNEQIIRAMLSEQMTLPQMDRKMGRLWIAARELMSVDYKSGGASIDHLILLEDVVRNWNGAASWGGLIAHLFGGVFAALGSLDLIRRQIRREPNLDLPEEVTKRPIGAFASAHYSLSKQMPTRSGRREQLDLALRFANEAIEDQKEREVSIYSVRGSVFIALLRPFAAVADFRRVVELYEAQAAETQKLGQAYVDLGSALCFSGRFFKGEEVLRRGVELLSAEEDGFLIRGWRRLAKLYRLTGRWRRAEEYNEKARALALRLRMFDQLRQIPPRKA